MDGPAVVGWFEGFEVVGESEQVWDIESLIIHIILKQKNMTQYS